MSDYKITFSPELNISAADFVDSWNEIEPCHKVAEASTETAAAQDFELISGGMVLAGLTFVAGMATTAINELIKQAIAEYFKKRQAANNPPPPALNNIEIQHIEQPDGSKLLVVLIKQ